MHEDSIFLVVHQSADLYGSDLSLLDALEAAPESVRPVIALPVEGPLTDELRKRGVETHIGPVCKISRTIGSVGGIVELGRSAIASKQFLRTVVGRRKLAFVYSNTVAVFGGALYARQRNAQHVWHVREIVQTPALAAWALPRIVRLLGHQVICNSNATRRWIEGDASSGSDRISVVWNGVEPPTQSPFFDRNAARAALGCQPSDVLVMLVGRINQWKGQEVLVRAFEMLVARGEKRGKAVIVGSPPPGQEHYLDTLIQRLRTSLAQPSVRVVGYSPQIWDLWRAADIAVVPSTQPEPFGRVAIEAMAVGLPVVASNHGGLAEIIVDGGTGFLVTPGDPESLAEALHKLIRDSDLRLRLGECGRIRHAAAFGKRAYVERMRAEFAKLVQQSSVPVVQ